MNGAGDTDTVTETDNHRKKRELKNMKKILILGAIVAIIVAGVTIATAGNQDQGKSPGPAPNSGDGIPDGSGFASFGGNGQGNGPGPAPNSGDGIADGPGW